MDRIEVSIKFCGGCNPAINRGRIAEEVLEHIIANGHTVSYNTPDADFIIYISGCLANCAEKYDGIKSASLVVAGASIDLMAVEESALAAEIIARGRNYFG
jgi:hypothetical protein